LGYSGLKAKMEGLESIEYDTELYDRLELKKRFHNPPSSPPPPQLWDNRMKMIL